MRSAAPPNEAKTTHFFFVRSLLFPSLYLLLFLLLLAYLHARYKMARTMNSYGADCRVYISLCGANARKTDAKAKANAEPLAVCRNVVRVVSRVSLLVAQLLPLCATVQ